MSKHFLVENGVLGHRRGREQIDNHRVRCANSGGGRTAQRQPGLRHPRLREHLRLAAWPPEENGTVRRLPPHPLAIPGQRPPGPRPAQGRPGSVGDSIEALDAATWAIEASERITASVNRAARNRRLVGPKLRRGQEDALLQLCAAPLATVSELARFNRESPTTLRGRLDRLAELGLADSVSHSLGALGPKPQRRYFPTSEGIQTAAAFEWGTKRFLADHPVSRQWFRQLDERLDAVAVLYHVAAMIANADPELKPVRVDRRRGPCDLLSTPVSSTGEALTSGRSLGIVRQGPMLSSANLRYRLRTLEQLRTRQRPTDLPPVVVPPSMLVPPVPGQYLEAG